jgi:hypothetical protein
MTLLKSVESQLVLNICPETVSWLARGKQSPPSKMTEPRSRGADLRPRLLDLFYVIAFCGYRIFDTL